MSDARAMARRMSYRKPVPIYIPSPPTSPHSPSKELDGQHVVVEEEIPPVCFASRIFRRSCSNAVPASR